MKKENLQALEDAHQAMMEHREDLSSLLVYFEKAGQIAAELLEELKPQTLQIWEAKPTVDQSFTLIDMPADPLKE
jgi:cell division FtsZ-interacting protein ZapD